MFQTFNGVAATPVWQGAIVHAFETWADAAHVDLDVLQPGDIPTVSSGRCGLVQIGAANLGNNQLATSHAFEWTGAIWSSDLLLNSSAGLEVGDLYNVVFHEASHLLGMDLANDVGDVFYQDGAGQADLNGATAIDAGSLSSGSAEASGTLTVDEDRLFHFVLSSQSANADMMVRMRVLDQNGVTLLTLDSAAGAAPANAIVHLKAGTYSLHYTAINHAGGNVAATSYQLNGELFSFCNGPYYSRPGENPPPEPTAPEYDYYPLFSYKYFDLAYYW